MRFERPVWWVLAEPWGVLLLALLATIALTLPLAAASGGLAEFASDPGLLRAAMTIQAVVLLIAGGVMGRRYRPGETAYGPGRQIVLGLAGGVVAVLASGAIGALLGLLGFEVEEQPWLQDLLGDRGMLVKLVPWIVVVGPIAEEVFFRGYAFRRFRGRVSFGAAAALSSLMFAVIHANPVGIPVYFVIGAVMAWLCERTRGMLAPCVGHMTVNAVVLVVSVPHT